MPEGVVSMATRCRVYVRSQLWRGREQSAVTDCSPQPLSERAKAASAESAAGAFGGFGRDFAVRDARLK